MAHTAEFPTKLECNTGQLQGKGEGHADLLKTREKQSLHILRDSTSWKEKIASPIVSYFSAIHEITVTLAKHKVLKFTQKLLNHRE